MTVAPRLLSLPRLTTKVTTQRLRRPRNATPRRVQPAGVMVGATWETRDVASVATRIPDGLGEWTFEAAQEARWMVELVAAVNDHAPSEVSKLLSVDRIHRLMDLSGPMPADARHDSLWPVKRVYEQFEAGDAAAIVFIEDLRHALARLGLGHDAILEAAFYGMSEPAYHALIQNVALTDDMPVPRELYPAYSIYMVDRARHAHTEMIEIGPFEYLPFAETRRELEVRLLQHVAARLDRADREAPMLEQVSKWFVPSDWPSDQTPIDLGRVVRPAAIPLDSFPWFVLHQVCGMPQDHIIERVSDGRLDSRKVRAGIEAVARLFPDIALAPFSKAGRPRRAPEQVAHVVRLRIPPTSGPDENSGIT